MPRVAPYDLQHETVEQNLKILKPNISASKSAFLLIRFGLFPHQLKKRHPNPLQLRRGDTCCCDDANTS